MSRLLRDNTLRPPVTPRCTLRAAHIEGKDATMTDLYAHLSKEEIASAVKQSFIGTLTEAEMKQASGERIAISIIALVIGLWLASVVGIKLV